MTTATKTHPFEAAGLGNAPFSCIGMTERVGPISYPDGTQVGYAGQPMGSCQFCGQGIRYCYIIQSADGKRFEVGCDCVEKTEQDELIRAVKSERQKLDDQRKREARKIELDAQRARNGGKTDAEIRNADSDARHAENQRKADMEKAADAERVAGLKFIGAIGQKLTVTVKVVARINLGGQWNTKLVKMVDADRNTFTWFSSSAGVTDGDIYEMTATVKDHSEYNGEKQTVVTRPKFSEVTA